MEAAWQPRQLDCIDGESFQRLGQFAFKQREVRMLLPEGAIVGKLPAETANRTRVDH